MYSESQKPKYEVVKKQESFTSLKGSINRSQEFQQQDPLFQDEKNNSGQKDINSNQMTQLEKEKYLNEQHLKERQEQEKLRLLKQFEMQKQNMQQQSDMFQYNYLQSLQTQIKNDNFEIGKFDRKTERIKKLENLNKIDPTKDLSLINKICLKRDFLYSQINKFYFEEQIKGCLVKIHYGNIENTDSYKIGRIQSVINGNQYKYNNAYINKYLVVEIDNDKNWEIKLTSVSNKDINERECFQLLEQFNQGVQINKDQINISIEKLKKYENYKMTQNDQLNIINKRLKLLEEKTLDEILVKKDLYQQKKNYLEQFKDLQNQDQKQEILICQENIERLSRQIKEICQSQQKQEKVSYLNFNQLKQEERTIYERKKAQPINMWNMDIEQVKNNEQICIAVKQESIQQLPDLDQEQVLLNFLQNFKNPLEIDSIINNWDQQLLIQI